MSTLVNNRGFDWDLSYKQKVVCAWIMGFVSFIPWIFYSTPNTIIVCGKIGEAVGLSVNLRILGLVLDSKFMAASFGVAISLAEYAAIGLYIWKRHWIFVTLLLICAGMSIAGSFVFQESGQNTVKMTKTEIDSYALIRDNWKELIDKQDNEISMRENQIKSIDLQEQQFQQRVWRGELSSIPSWIAARKREAAESIQLANNKKEVLSDSLSKYTFSVVKKTNDAGYLVDFGKQSKSVSFAFSFLVEFIIIVAGFIWIGLWNSAAQDTETGNNKPASVPDNTSDVTGCDVTPLTPPVIPVTGNNSGNTFGTVTGNTSGHKKGNTSGNNSGNKKGDTIGFKIQGDNPNKLQKEIIEVYEEYKKRNILDQMNVSEMARVINRSRKYIYTTLQAFTDFQARGKQN